MTHETPQPRCAASSAARITAVLPVQSNVLSMPHPPLSACSACTMVLPSAVATAGSMHVVAPNASAWGNLLGLVSMA